MDTLTILSCHSDSDLKIKAILHNIKFLFEISSTIVIVNSIEFLGILESKLPETYSQKSIIINDVLTNELCYVYRNTYPDLKYMSNAQLKQHWIKFGKHENRKFPIPIYKIYFDYTQNDKFVCHGKWLYALSKYNYANYTNLILTNDSIVITRSLYDFKQLMTPTTEMVALLDSYETQHHYPDFLRAYNSVGIKKIIDYYEKNKQNITDFLSMIIIYEIQSSNLFNSVSVLFKSPETPVNIHINNTLLSEYLYTKQYPVVKLKKIIFTQYTAFPSDFNSKEYKLLNADLINFTDEDAKLHFINHGMHEGRLYKNNQSIHIPACLENYLKLVGFQI